MKITIVQKSTEASQDRDDFYTLAGGYFARGL